MTIVAADIKALPSGEFAALDDAVVTRYIEKAKLQVSEQLWASKYDEGVESLAAHLLSVAIAGAVGPSGPVAAETIGPMSRTYASYAAFSGTDKDSLNATSYGREYKRLRATLGLTGFVV